MQILESTWNGILARHQIPPGGAEPPSRYNPHDAIHAAAFYLCDNGAPGDLRRAVFAYNHAYWYVDKVLTQATLYRDAPATGGPPSRAALVAVAFDQSQLGQPYVWGGDGGAEGGFDCSGLTHAALSNGRNHHPTHRAHPVQRRPTPAARNPATARGISCSSAIGPAASPTSASPSPTPT